MKKVSLIARYLLALLLVVFGLNKFLHFMPAPEYALGSPALAYMNGLSGVHLFPVLGVIYLLCAIMLSIDKMVGLATMILSAIAFNILLFHLMLDPANLAPGLVFTALLILVMAGHKSKYAPLLS